VSQLLANTAMSVL